MAEHDIKCNSDHSNGDGQKYMRFDIESDKSDKHFFKNKQVGKKKWC